MWKLIGATCGLSLLLLLAKPRDERFLHYKVVEAYEIRPGILVMPRYAADGQICQAVIQKENYSNEVVHLDPTMPREVVDQIVDELVPDNERGPLTLDKEMSRLSVYVGNAVTSFVDYQNVSVDIERRASSTGEIVALIKWKHAACK